MDNKEAKMGGDRPYAAYRANSYNYPVEPQSANSFLRHSKQGNTRSIWNEQLERSANVKLENPLDKMKRLDREFQKNEKKQYNTGKNNYEFLRHTIDYTGKGYHPEEYGIGKNRDHYQSSYPLRKYTDDDADSPNLARKYNNTNPNPNENGPKQIDFLARHQYHKNLKSKAYTDVGANGETNQQELSYDLSRNAKSPRHRYRTEGEFDYQKLNLSYTVNRPKYEEYCTTPKEQIKIAKTNTYAFEKKYDIPMFNKKAQYQYYTPKSDSREESSPMAKKSPTPTATGLQSPSRKSGSKPSSIISSLRESTGYPSKYEAYSPQKKIIVSRALEEEQQKEKNVAFSLNITKMSVSLTPRQKKPENVALSLECFEIGKCLGEGKFGNVYVAIHKENRSLFALKKVKKDQIRQHKMENQFMMEIKMQLHFNHKNVLGLYGFFDDETYVYLVLEYMEEGTLYSKMKKDKKLSEADTSRRMKEVLDGIKYLHDMNIAHRDIKPQNIVISNGVCKLCDFGWAAICDERRKTLCGTPDYVTPQVLKGQGYGIEVDLWCLGVLCYELLVGKAPFYHAKIKETMKRIMNADTADVKIPNEMSSEAKDFICNLIVNDPEKRMTAEDALQHPFITKYAEEEPLCSPTRK